jgi:chromosome segregation ATPase
MKKTLITYLLIPGILLAAFIFFYLGAVKEMEAKATRQKAEKLEKERIELVRKADIEKRAVKDAEDRQKQRDADEAAKLAKKEADYQAVMTQLRTETVDLNAQSDKLAKEVGGLEISISQARTNKEKLNRETFDLAKEVELAKINRRNAEIEIQRMVEMAGKKMADSSVAIAPPPPPPNVAK